SAVGGTAKAGTVKLAFTGPIVAAHSDELDTTGGTGTAIVVQAAGKNITFDGVEGGANTLKDGDNVLHYTAIVKKSSVAQSISEGAFSAVANFNLIYQ
ncbi:TPA: P fimbria major subunit PapA, partial [Escherichia coli]